MTDSELQQKTDEIVATLRRAKSERAAVSNDLSQFKIHMSGLNDIAHKIRYDDTLSALVVGSGANVETVKPWPTHEQVTTAAREHKWLDEEVRRFQDCLHRITGIDRELLEP